MREIEDTRHLIAASVQTRPAQFLPLSEACGRVLAEPVIAPMDSKWGDFRLVFLQHASDPITFFDPAMMWREPSWMQSPRGFDVTPDLRWFPVVTSLQLAADMIVGTAPPGFGHEFAPAEYIDAWMSLTEPEGWQPAALERLRRQFEENVR